MSITTYGYTEFVCEKCGETIRYDTCSKDDAIDQVLEDGWTVCKMGAYCPKCKWTVTSMLSPCPRCGRTPGMSYGKDGYQFICDCKWSDPVSGFERCLDYWCMYVFLLNFFDGLSECKFGHSFDLTSEEGEE